MAKFGTTVIIDGVKCAITMRGRSNGYYVCTFERDKASLEDIESINWNNPVLTKKKNDCVLPDGYGYEVDSITYSSITSCYTVEIKVLTQYLGDVTDYVNQVAELTAQVSELQSSVSSMTAEVAQKDETIESLTATNTSLNAQLINATKLIDEASESVDEETVESPVISES